MSLIVSYCRLQISFAVFQQHLVSQYKNALVFFLHKYQSCRRFKPLLWALVVTCDVASSRLLSHSPRASAASYRSRRFRSSSPEEQRGQREDFRVYRKGLFDGWTVATSGNVSWINYDGDSAETSFHIRGRESGIPFFFSFSFRGPHAERTPIGEKIWTDTSENHSGVSHISLLVLLSAPLSKRDEAIRKQLAPKVATDSCVAHKWRCLWWHESVGKGGGHGNMHYDAEALGARK